MIFINFHIFKCNLGHTGSVFCLNISADGTEIISGSGDTTLRRWLVATGQCLQVYRGHSKGVLCVALLPNGSVVSGSNDKLIKVWNRLTGECLYTLNGHTSSVYGITVCPCGDFVSASFDGSLRVWCAGSSPSDPFVSRQIIADAHSRECVNCITTVPGTDDLISGGGDNTVKLWRRAKPSADFKCIRTFAGHTNLIACVAVMDNHNIVSGSSDNTVKIWSMETGECLYTLRGHTNSVVSVAVLPCN